MKINIKINKNINANTDTDTNINTNTNINININTNINTKYIGKKIIHFHEIDSTQKEAERRIKNKVAENGEIIIADNQTQGKGTHGREWYTGNNKNIAFSIILFPKCNINQIQNLTILIAECMVESLRNLYQINIEIKNPNDLVINKLKLGGILTQITTLNEVVETLIIGVGLNVKEQVFIKELTSIATSLKREFPNIEFSIKDIINEFCEVFEKEYDKLVK